MISLKATIRKKFGRQTKALRGQGLIPAVLYGEGIKNLSLEVPEKDFGSVFQEAGESSIVKLKIKNQKSKISEEPGLEEIDVLIHQIAKDPLTGKFLHIDFFHPSAEKKVEAEIPLVFGGEAPAVKDLGGTLVKELQFVKVKGLAHKLPREIKVALSVLRTFGDRLYIRDLKVPEGVELLRRAEEIVAHVTSPKKVKEEEPMAEKAPVGEKENKK